jgi:hypothetical protein
LFSIEIKILLSIPIVILTAKYDGEDLSAVLSFGIQSSLNLFLVRYNKFRMNYIDTAKFIVKLHLAYSIFKRNTPPQHDQNDLERSVNYFVNFGAECHLFKIGCSKSSFTKHRCKCNLHINLLLDYYPASIT